MNYYSDAVMDIARRFLNSNALRPVFSDLEKQTLTPFFTNNRSRVFFVHTLPEAVVDVLMSMYSRMKNPRGIRGVFVDSFLPLFLASTLKETGRRFEGSPEKYLAHYKVTSLEKFVAGSKEARQALSTFLDSIHVDPKYIMKLSAAPRVKKFLSLYLDKYGHNSIARMAKLSLCLENISILAAKSLEWTRPGTGYIELSTRFVDMSMKSLYPIWKILAEYGVSEKVARGVVEREFKLYQHFLGENFNGLFPSFLRERYRPYFPDERDLETGVIGESCDVLGNFLPCATLTSVGVAMSGEAYPEVLKHLVLDNTPENLILVEMILEEAKKIGGDQFSRHYEPTEWKKEFWKYLLTEKFYPNWGLRVPGVYYRKGGLVSNREAEIILVSSFCLQNDNLGSFSDVLDYLRKIPRGEYDKLPNHFEVISGSFNGVMSFRGWRDLQRQQLCTHYRTRIDPRLGFYLYDKPAPENFFQACRVVEVESCDLYDQMRSNGVPSELMEYPMPLGNLVGFQIGANLTEMEFCTWQRSKYGVNHEVRQIFLGIERELRGEYPWWKELSRADMTPAYIFARTKEGVPLPKN